jgi:hypothetical protein
LNPDPNKVKELKRKIDDLINTYNVSLDRRIAADLSVEYKIKHTPEQISKMKPFHWRLKFSDVFSKNIGFDIIIGNPPYIKRERIITEYPTVFLKTDTCRNTYAYFFEISLNLLNSGGYIGFIVPVSSVCTDTMMPLQEMLKSNCNLLKVSNFDDRPSKIFGDLEHCRSSIIIGRKKENENEPTKIYSTRYNRWYSEERV